MTWHFDASTVAQYRDRSVDAAVAASVEAHLMECERCRGLIAESVDDRLLSFVWDEIEDELDRAHLGLIERTLVALGWSDATARIVAATTRARWSYLFVVAFSVLVAVSSSTAPHSDERFIAFLLIAPLGPLVATACAFGRWVDPAHALLRTLATSTWRMVLIRTAAAVVPAVALTALATPWLIERGWMAAAWLLPSLALALIVLALSSWIDVELATLVVGSAWIAVPVGLRFPVSDLIGAFGGPIQIVSLAVGGGAAMIAIVRRTRFDYRRL